MTETARNISTDDQLGELVVETLDDAKAEQIVMLDVAHLTSITNAMVIATGRTDRHVKAIANQLVERCKASGFATLDVEGRESGEWVLVDLGDVVVHLMQPRVRDFYQIEKLWDMTSRDDAAQL